MPDVVPPDVRSRMMSGIRGKDTKPEMLLRRALHADGFRYRLHDKSLPGRPDLVFPRYDAVIFVNGCFWHGHPDCAYFKLPTSRTQFWATKIERTRERDAAAVQGLLAAGWRVATVWECATRNALDATEGEVAEWLTGGLDRMETNPIRSPRAKVRNLVD